MGLQHRRRFWLRTRRADLQAFSSQMLAAFHECDLILQQRTGSARAVGITANQSTVLDQLLADAYGMEVHAEQVGHRCIVQIVVRLAADLTQVRVDLARVAALDVISLIELLRPR